MRGDRCGVTCSSSRQIMWPVQAAIEKMMQSNWQRHFSLLDI
ncbi:MAG: hypothetical protein RQM92_06210 [Candidatus Syntrophopropionicum ammoniitolerans]